MTEQQEIDFDKYGCGCRCLIEWNRLRERPVITKQEFCKTYDRLFPNAATEYGGVITSTLIDIGRLMNLCWQADTVVSKDLVRNVQLDNVGVILMTEKMRRKDGTRHDMNHCRLLLRWDEKGNWIFWHPKKDGKADDNYPMTDTEIDDQVPHFLLLYSTET